MTRNSWIIFCWAYIVGLLSTNLVARSDLGLTGQQLFFIAGGLGGLTIIMAIALKIWRRYSSRPRIYLSLPEWLAIAAVAILAVVYLQLRIPQPDSNDISYQAQTLNGEVVTVTGKIVTEPKLSASQKIKFWLEAQEINDNQPVSGRLYTNVPLLQGTGINLGEELKLRGILYIPQGAVTPNGFDFKRYLARQGIFAGMQGLEVVDYDDSEAKWGWWKLRRRIVQSQLKGLGSPVGQLVSSMVLGRKAVDLPEDIRDRFIEAGLAHVFAASGFHVSLLLGLILKLTSHFAAKSRLVTGIVTLIVYLGLTGIQPSVLRACLMGVVVLIALVMDTKVKPLGSLLLIATIILLFNPLLINDLGFQLSFLATFGLIVTMPGLQKQLDWLPQTIATLIAVPVAASIWVLPLLSYVFNRVATYSVVVNIICTPLIVLISLGGMISAIAALIVPVVGSAISLLLLYPTRLLMAIVNFFINIPGSSWATGQISLSVLLIIYGLFLLVWLNQWWRKHLWLVLLFIFTLITVPVGYKNFNLTQITILPAQLEPVIVVQDRGKVVLINSGKPQAIKYTVLPFLAQQGINHLDYFISLNPNNASNWTQLGDRYRIDNIIVDSSSQHLLTSNSDKVNTHRLERAIVTNSFKISFEDSLPILKLQTTTETWLILGKTKPHAAKIKEYIEQKQLASKPIVLVGSTIDNKWLKLEPQSIIANNESQAAIGKNTLDNSYYSLRKNGAIIWTPQNGFSSTREMLDNNIL